VPFLKVDGLYPGVLSEQKRLTSTGEADSSVYPWQSLSLLEEEKPLAWEMGAHSGSQSKRGTYTETWLIVTNQRILEARGILNQKGSRPLSKCRVTQAHNLEDIVLASWSGLGIDLHDRFSGSHHFLLMDRKHIAEDKARVERLEKYGFRGLEVPLTEESPGTPSSLVPIINAAILKRKAMIRR
jgi:hypothetical protein